jgi:hypothetical protein
MLFVRGALLVAIGDDHIELLFRERLADHLALNRGADLHQLCHAIVRLGVVHASNPDGTSGAQFGLDRNSPKVPVPSAAQAACVAVS